jgi:hypothetical protein
MPMRTFHPCAFNFQKTNIRRVGNVADGGTSLSGITQEIETDGGGFLQADFSDGFTLDKTAGNAWRALSDADAGEAFVVLLCAERLFQPVGALATVPHSDVTPFGDATLYTSPGADYTTTAAAALRATSIQITGASELSLIGGELFSVDHPTWGWRAYRVRSIDGDTISFRPPLREAVPAGTELEFDTPRCQMRFVSAVGNDTDIGRYGNCAVGFVEDMRKPAGA